MSEQQNARLHEIQARLDEITAEQVAGRGDPVAWMREKLELIAEERRIRKGME